MAKAVNHGEPSLLYVRELPNDGGIEFCVQASRDGDLAVFYVAKDRALTLASDILNIIREL